MFTLFDLFMIAGPVLGLVLGVIAGRHYGVYGSLAGAVAGFLLGLAAGRLPWGFAILFMRSELRAKSTSQLWSELRGDDCLTPQFLLLELWSRREPIDEGLNLVLSMMTSEDRDRRCRGWVALESAFPVEAKRLSEYNPDAPASEMLEVVNRARSDH